MGRKTFRRETWEFLNKKGSSRNTSWWVPKVPSILQMLFRSGILFVLNLGLWAIEIILIQGEDVFWSFNYVDRIYKNIGSNPQDLSTLVVLSTWLIIWGVGGIIWIVGFWDRWVS